MGAEDSVMDEMELVGDGADVGRDGGVGNVVVVGVKFDGPSRELLTWALMKVAHPGDLIIALHVIDTVPESPSSLLSLVKTFDTILGVYEGFCSLKQVDLRLKLCRGTSVRKILARETNSCGASTLILGTSKTHHTIRSSASVAKYCASKLPKHLSVFAVDNGKTVFQREAFRTKTDSSQDCDSDAHFLRLGHRSSNKNLKGSKARKKLNEERRNSSQKSSQDELKTACILSSGLPCNFDFQSFEESCGDERAENSLALVPIQTQETDSGPNSSLMTYAPQQKFGWLFLRRVFLPKQENPKKSLAKKMSVVRWVLKFKGQRHSASMVYPDEKQSHSDFNEICSPCLDRENGAIVPFGTEAVWPPSSPCSGFNNLPKELEGLHDRYSSTCRLFSYQELLSATSNFSPENMVGKGGSSYVYRGRLPDGKELAVKILKPSIDVVKEFVLEIEVVTSLHHQNIVSLFGFCFENGNLLLVYDFLSRGSLEENLHGNKTDANRFGWSERYKVAIGVAEALDYLHNGQEQPVIHRDVKSSNILLSDDFEPQLSDFGLASWTSNTSSHRICTDVAGTFGYLAPEYFMHGKVSDKVDVYAFGIVLLELLSGRKPIYSGYTKGQESLVMWAKPILEGGKMSPLLDPSLGSNYDAKEFERMVLAAALCIRRSPRRRPQMSLVMKLLQGDEEMTNWGKQQMKASEEVDGLEEEEEDAFPSNIQSHLNLALLDIEDDSVSMSSPEQSVSIEDYLGGRWSRTSSFY